MLVDQGTWFPGSDGLITSCPSLWTSLSPGRQTVSIFQGSSTVRVLNILCVNLSLQWGLSCFNDSRSWVLYVFFHWFLDLQLDLMRIPVSMGQWMDLMDSHKCWDTWENFSLPVLGYVNIYNQLDLQSFLSASLTFPDT